MSKVFLPTTLICGYYDCSEFGTLKTSPGRTAKSFEIEYYLENGFETYLNGEKIPIYADRILIAKPGDVRYSRLPFKTAFLKFNADGVIAEMLNSSPKYFTAVHKKQILELMHEIIVLNERQEKDPLLSGGKLLTLLSIIIDDGKCEQLGQGVNRQLMHRAKKYIEEHLGEHISTTDIAESVGLSESRFRVLFGAAYGVSPHKYLTDARISAAKEMLWNTETPLLEIAEKCGFGSQQYFNDIFKKTVGISPGKYRVQFAKKYTDEVDVL